jgi:hypothetical protein
VLSALAALAASYIVRRPDLEQIFCICQKAARVGCEHDRIAIFGFDTAAAMPTGQKPRGFK